MSSSTEPDSFGPLHHHIPFWQRVPARLSIQRQFHTRRANGPFIDLNRWKYKTMQSPLFDWAWRAECHQGDRAERLRAAIEKLRMPHHVNEADCWYSCQKSMQCCADFIPPAQCTCGADQHNQWLDFALEIVKELS